MQRFLTTTILVATTFVIYACGGYANSSPTSPTVTTVPPATTAPPATATPPAAEPPPAGATVTDVVRENGAQSFSPNPATVPPGQMVVWHNVDTVTHRVVLNNGALDTGNIAPGASSAPMILPAVGGYHCSIHPSMVGTIVSGQ